jgi:hypothetical protein
MLKIKLNRRRGSRSHRVVPRNLGTSVPRIATCWLEPAATRLRTGQGWDEGTTGDVLREVLHVYREHVKKALGLALRSGKF